jgi:hypothetical protein
MKKVTILLKSSVENGRVPQGLLHYNNTIEIYYKNNYLILVDDMREQATFTLDEIEYMEIN